MIEAALVTIKIYIKALLNLKKSKNLQIFVHPINPVLNETRFFFFFLKPTIKSNQ